MEYKSYAEEHLIKAEHGARFAEIGLREQVREVAEALAICPMSDVRLIAEKLIEYVEAYEIVAKEVDYYRNLIERENKRNEG